MSRILQERRMQDESDQLEKHIRYLSFLQKSNAEISYPLQAQAWFDSLLPLKNNIEKLGMFPEVSYRNQDNSLLVRGFLVGTSDVMTALNGRVQPPMVHLHGLHTLWINEDIESHGTYTNPGISLSFIAPYWKIIGNRTMNLEGATGADGANGAGAGSPGVPGNAGGNGGSFYGKGKSFHNTGAFAVRTNGGRGGNGGNGARGADGPDGADGTFETIDSNKITKKVGTIDSPAWIGKQETTNGDYWGQAAGGYYYYESQGAPGTVGGNGGPGGAAGYGGRAGTVIMDGYPAWRNPANHDSALGNPGNPGSGGTGGKHGRRYEGMVTVKWHHDHGRYKGKLQCGNPKGSNFGTVGSMVPVGLKPSQEKAPGGYESNGLNSADQQVPRQPAPFNAVSLIALYNKYYSSQDTHFLGSGNGF